MYNQSLTLTMELMKGERIICPAIWIDDGKKHDGQPDNIETGYVQYGLHLVDIFYRMARRGTGMPLDMQNLTVHDIHEGYYTNFKRFIKKRIDF